ncbi:MAG: histidine kinase [Acidobacteriota bacterium]
MRSVSLWLVLSALVVGTAFASAPPSSLRADEVAWRVGDDPAWASPTYDDRQWERIDLFELTPGDDLFWLRTTFDLSPEHQRSTEPLALVFSGLASCDFYWDGKLLEAPGLPGQDMASEEPGLIDTRIYLPVTLTTAGRHVAAARCSSHHRQLDLRTNFYVWSIAPLVPNLERTRGYSWLAMISLTAKLIATVYFLVAFWVRGRRSWSALWMALFSLTVALLLIAEAWRSLIGYTYDWHIPRLVMVLVLAWLATLWLVAYFLTRFPGRWRREVGVVMLLASLSVPLWVPSFDYRVALVFLIGLATCLLWGALATLRRQFGGWLATLGVGSCVVIYLLDPGRFFDQRIFFALDLLVLMVLITEVLRARHERDALEAERLRATRLELELVKKSIQPHFLMNTLTALAEWFEREPDVAGEVIEALSREIRLLGELAEQRTVPLRRELDLCRAHLDVMGFRQSCTYHLQVEGIDEDRPCPPGIIHTMVENAVTHGPSPQGRDIVIELRQEAEEHRWLYALSSPLGDEPSAATNRAIEREGTGMRYIRTRLAEAFGDRFDLSHHVDSGVFVVTWSVPA